MSTIIVTSLFGAVLVMKWKFYSDYCKKRETTK